ncbi:MAG: hypothetical protein HGA87_05220 [Desulfobulbaceae bacterium]|nr:hypothetical protein [Desulfobulbaceae bacterium]
MHECTICQEYGFRFKRNYQPVEFIEGQKDSLIWIVGLNPAVEQNWVDARTAEELCRYFDDPKTIHGYFKDFKAVSGVVFNGFGKPQGTAHTDIVKCSSKSFPPETAKGKRAAQVISNCKRFLEIQLKQFKPKIIVCNGTEVSKFMLNFLPPPARFTKSQTSYWSHIDDQKVCVVLSGFIGRIDNYAKRRLGIEIESRLHEIQSPQT